MGSIGMPELLIILFIVLILFGSSRLPGLMKALGQGMKEFRTGAKDDAQEKS
jgi:sec-independent protein translocase protein TatA